MTFIVTYKRNNRILRMPVEASSLSAARTVFYRYFCKKCAKIISVKPHKKEESS